VTRRPSTHLVPSFERLQQGVRQRHDRQSELTGLRTKEAALTDEVGRLARDCGLTAPDDTLASAHLLASTATEMRKRRATLERTTEERARLERQEERERAALERLRAERAALDERLAGIGDGDVEEGLRRFRTRTEAAAGAARLRQDLVAEHPDLEALKARIGEAEAKGEDWTLDTTPSEEPGDALARRRARIQELDDHVEALIERTASLDAEIDQLSGGETLDRVDGESAVLEEDVRRLERERDRRYVLASLVREAERRFREEHQPELARRAGEYLATITDGRYARVLLNESAGAVKGEVSFKVRGSGSNAPVPVAAPLSTATREQVYLALRLAAVDHLDREGERLPLFLDEALVNWDPSRRDRGLSLIARLATQRQVFVFTAHPDVAARLGGMGARIVRLEPPR
jgi:uncharacterized protein YhaN